MKHKSERESFSEAIIVMAELNQIDKDYPLVTDGDGVQQLKTLAIEKALLDFANKSLQSIDDEDDDL